MWNDLSLAARLLMRDRSFTLTAIGALTLGIAANSLVFTLVNGAVAFLLLLACANVANLRLATVVTRGRRLMSPAGRPSMAARRVIMQFALLASRCSVRVHGSAFDSAFGSPNPEPRTANREPKMNTNREARTEKREGSFPSDNLRHPWPPVFPAF